MAQIIDVREVVSSHIVTRDDGKRFTLQIIRFLAVRTAMYETFSYACEVYERHGSNEQVKFPDLQDNGQAQLTAAALAAIAVLQRQLAQAPFCQLRR